ncbi:hypothetical protein J2T12_001953 [Paenibacillus anaericanus]|uniref:hypothetical protein n=1 Tax=Paenibacillus anaericanus TaxID=170367 RepID=UPI002787603E|nr:hypothetical protein [Paenibacillus anaericanus]MDQ0088547.1 hypothetical protein [Paenibacillus anaericanus]
MKVEYCITAKDAASFYKHYNFKGKTAHKIFKRIIQVLAFSIITTSIFYIHFDIQIMFALPYGLII